MDIVKWGVRWLLLASLISLFVVGCGGELPPFDVVGDVEIVDVLTDNGRVDLGHEPDVLMDDGQPDVRDDILPVDVVSDVDVDVCTPDCTDRDCGDNGCGGSCGDCGVAMACSEGFKCETVSCETDLACQAHEAVCDPLSKLCVPCLTAEDCSEGSYVCLGLTCTEVTFCSSSLDCTNEVCDPVRGYCVACLEDVDCGLDMICRDTECISVTPCDSSLDCTDQVCNKTKGYCVNCIADADCGQNSECLDDTCVDYVPCVSDLTCTPLGKLCDKVAGRCVRCLTDEECPAVYHCADDDCVLDICVPETGSCDGNVAVECLANGSGFGEPVACLNDQYCQAGDCFDQICVPDFVSCNENILETCNSLGSDYSSRLDCGDQAVCLDAQCVPKICVPLEMECATDFSWSQCNLFGTEWGDATSCPGGFYCDGGVCEAQVCEPSEAFCTDEVTAAMCDARGSGPSISLPCDDEKVCVEGTCLPVVCTPGAATCTGNSITTCDESGTGYESVPCEIDQYCEDGACLDHVCQPNAVACNGNISETCNELGSGIASTIDCSDFSQVCHDGDCCTPDCSGLECGDDGCGGSCGECSPGEACTDGVCVVTWQSLLFENFDDGVANGWSTPGGCAGYGCPKVVSGQFYFPGDWNTVRLPAVANSGATLDAFEFSLVRAANFGRLCIRDAYSGVINDIVCIQHVADTGGAVVNNVKGSATSAVNSVVLGEPGTNHWRIERDLVQKKCAVKLDGISIGVVDCNNVLPTNYVLYVVAATVASCKSYVDDFSVEAMFGN